MKALTIFIYAILAQSTAVYNHQTSSSSDKYYIVVNLENSIVEPAPGALHLLEHVIISPKSKSSKFHEYLKLDNGEFNAITTPGNIRFYFSGEGSHGGKLVKELVIAINNPDFSSDLIDYEIGRVYEEIKNHKTIDQLCTDKRNALFDNYVSKYSTGHVGSFSNYKQDEIAVMLKELHKKLLSSVMTIDVASNKSERFEEGTIKLDNGVRVNSTPFLKKNKVANLDCKYEKGLYFSIRHQGAFNERTYERLIELISKDYPSFSYAYPLYRTQNEQLIYFSVDPKVEIKFDKYIKMNDLMSVNTESSKHTNKSIKSMGKLKTISLSRNIIPASGGSDDLALLLKLLSDSNSLRVF